MKTIFLFITMLFSIHVVSHTQSDVKKALNSKDNSLSIMIDAGHGGKDSGCLGIHHKEKDIALSIALKLGKKVEDRLQNATVHYTRKDDTFIPLFERINAANDKKVDLFLSVHCNYAKNKSVNGTETFVMGLHRAEENLEVAKRENEVILLENDHEVTYDGFDPSSTEGHIILSMYQNLYLDQSIDFASKVENSLQSKRLAVSRGVKQAGFVVLRRATMPAVLIETGFLSNTEEEAYLGSDKGQEEIAESIFKAMVDFLDATAIPEKAEPELTVVTNHEVKTNTEYKKSEDIKQKNAKEISSSPKVQTTPTAVSPPKVYRLQLAALKSETEAYDHLEKKLGYPLNVLHQNGYVKYQIGNFLSREDAEKAKKRLAELGISQGFIVTYSSEK